MEDDKIIALFWERSEIAISETKMKYAFCLQGISYQILRNWEDAQECVNDTYMKAWNNIPPTRPNNLKAYLARIVRNISISRFRQKTAVKRGNCDVKLSMDELDECIPAKETVESKLDEVLLKELLNEYLDSLEEEKRLIFMKRYWSCLSVKEIARQMKVKEKYVTNSLYQSRLKLKDYLGKAGVVK